MSLVSQWTRLDDLAQAKALSPRNLPPGLSQHPDLAQGVADGARAAVAKRASPFLNTAQAAYFIGISPRTLERMRLEARGPIFRKHGRQVRYHIRDLEAWSMGLAGEAGRGHD